MKAINDTPTPVLLDGETAFVDFYRNQYQRAFRLAWLRQWVGEHGANCNTRNQLDSDQSKPDRWRATDAW